MTKLRRDLRDVVARNICSALKASKVPVKSVALQIGVAESTISQWRNGKRCPTIQNIERLAVCYGIKPCRLLCSDADSCPEAD